MKKILYSLAAIALVAAVSCSREAMDVPSYLEGGSPATVTFSLTQAGGINTKAIADGTTANKVQVGVYEVGDEAITLATTKDAVLSAKTGTVSLTLVKGKTYKLAFWAGVTSGSPYTVNFGQNEATVTASAAPTANSEANDAFYALVEYTVPDNDTDSQAITLTRPLAQVAILTPTEVLGYGTLTTSGITVKNAYTKMNLLTGEVSEKADVTFANAAASFDNETAPKDGYSYVAVGYVLAAANGGVNDIDFNANENTEYTYNVSNAPLKRNYRTLLLGNIFPAPGNTSETTWDVTLDPTFGGGSEANVGGEVPTVGYTGVTLPAEYDPEATDNASLDIDATDDDPTVTFTVQSNSPAPINVESSNTAVATVAIEEGEVTITPVGNGETVITVSQDAYTPAANPAPGHVTKSDGDDTSYSAYSYSFLVKVTGVVANNIEAEAAEALALSEGETGSAVPTVTNPAEGYEIAYESSDTEVATVAADGTVTAVAEGSATITVTISADGFEDLVLTTEVTVSAEVTEAKELPYSELFTTGIGDFVTDGATIGETTMAVWTEAGNYGMKATGYTSNTDYDAESWLTSPYIDLSGATAPVFSFDHATNFFSTIDKAKEEATVWVKVKGGDWAQVDITYPTSLGWTFVSSGEIDLSEYIGELIQIGFKYTSTSTKAGTWEVKNFLVEDATSPIETEIEVPNVETEVRGTVTLTVNTNNTDGVKSFESQNTAVATVDENGVVTGVAEGTATITISIAAEGRYTANSTTCQVTVNAAGTVTYYSLYSGDITEGDYVIYYDGKAMNTTTTTNRLQYKEVTPSDDKIADPVAAIIWHISASGDYWVLYNEAEGLYAVSTGNKNQATTANEAGDKGLWTITETDGTYEIVNVSNSAASINCNLRNNGTYGFACYSTQTGGALSLYKKN